ncbi:MAG: TonB-dependent receptor [Alphaproteobacteria bacterium]|nr:TonB-dependent receptor [Alphaproteobacteria bacterium]
MRSKLSLLALMPLLFTHSTWAGDISGTLREESGAPLPNAPLMLQDAYGKTAATLTTDTEGHFHFPSIAPGSYLVIATQGEGMLGSMSVSVMDETSIRKDLTLRPKQPMNILIARRLQEARNNLSPRTGTSAYKINSDAISAMPRGADTSFNQVLEQAPGVARDSFGQLRVRGEHANLQYRLNGILLPESINGFGQVLDSRVVENSTLLTGILPAQYGYRTVGVVDIQTKHGFEKGGEAGMQVGSYGTLQPSITYGGTWNRLNYFFAASHLTSDMGIEPPTSSPDPIHDHTEQDKQFAYMSYMIDPSQRVDLVAGNSIGHFEIPNNPGQTPVYTLGSISNFDSSQLNERQFESNQYAALAWQKSTDRGLDFQIAPYIRHSEVHFMPDPVGDLIFNGVASDVTRSNIALGVQTDGSYRLNEFHTLRSGLMLQQEYAATDNTSQVFPVMGGIPLTTPETIIDNTRKEGQLYGIYLQDEWRAMPALTINYGARFDTVTAYVQESQISPRLGMVYKLDKNTALHAGYARYFTPPPLELISGSSISKFDGTTNEALNTQNDPVKSERSHNFGLGVTHQLTDEIQIGADAYYKMVSNLLDEGQFGQALVFTPFNYDEGKIYGIEFTASYTTDSLKAYANLAISRAMGRKITSAQFNFEPDELDYINNNFVHLDHDQTYTASGGISYQIQPRTAVSLDGIFGSGLRKGFANSEHLPWYTQFDASIAQEINLLPHNKTTLRFSIVNLFDTAYELRDGSGIGVGAPQWGPRRGFYASLTQSF